MDQFIARVIAQLDTKTAEATMQSFLSKYKSNPLQIKLDVDGLQNLKSITKQSSAQFAKLGIDAGKSYNTAMQKQIIAQANTQRNAFSQPLKNLNKQQKNYSDWWNKELQKSSNMNYGKNQQTSNQYTKLGTDAGRAYNTALQKQIMAQANTQRNAFSRPLNDFQKQQKEYSNWFNNELNKPKNINYGKNQQEIALEKQMVALRQQTLAASKIKKQIDQGYLDADVSGIKKGMSKHDGNTTSSYKDAEKTYSRLLGLQKELQSGQSMGKALSPEDTISKWNQFNDVLAKSKNQMKVLSNESSMMANDKQIASFQKRLTSFYDANTKMHKTYGQQVKNIMSEANAPNLTTSEFDKLQTKYANISRDVEMKGLKGKSPLAELGRAATQIAQFAGIYGVIQNVVYDGARQIKQAVVDVNKAQIELTKVSDAPTNELKSYFSEADVSAKKYGSTISDVITSTADWSRLGYGLKDSRQLSDITTLYQKVGDNMTQETASKSLISTLQGFGLDPSNAEGIIDKFNHISNNFAIGSDGIGEALQRSAATFKAGNTGLSKSIALIAGTNEVVQDPLAVGNMWKTVGMRIRGTKQELELAGEDTEGMVESTSKLRELVQGLTGFDIMSDESGTQFKDIYDIVVGIGDQWQSLNDIDQAGLLEALSGKRQGNALAAALDNISTIKEAYSEGEFNSKGSANKELENWNKGIEASQMRFKSQVQDFSTTLIDSDVFKGFVDGGTAALSVVTELLDTVGLIPMALGGVGIASFVKNLD